jgi:hypothetical protein
MCCPILPMEWSTTFTRVDAPLIFEKAHRLDLEKLEIAKA